MSSSILKVIVFKTDLSFLISLVFVSFSLVCAWHCQMLVFYRCSRVCGVRAELGSLVLVSCDCA